MTSLFPAQWQIAKLNDFVSRSGQRIKKAMYYT